MRALSALSSQEEWHILACDSASRAHLRSKASFNESEPILSLAGFGGL
eukprot:CAMPEP_0170628050 /NCGR_PEP_ID=MMETSP0224-20130122/32413_1 /TAXON_ID=285029 /ORGANISM="Togula jolla, Strain CCCM 725" /LENGTH=47 /DNA_ID= /DNA_START= /DNA_END= /DNA_ORIENTATION=